MLPQLLAATALALGGCGRAPEPVSQAPRPSLVKIVLDDFGWSEVALAPQISAFADAHCLRFGQFYADPTCSPTRYMMDFGRYPRTQMTLNAALLPAPGGIGDLPFNAQGNPGERIPLSELSIFEALMPTHRTALVGKWHLGRAPLLDEMNQVPSGPYCQGVSSWTGGSDTVIETNVTQGYYSWRCTNNGDTFLSTEYATDVQRTAALAQLAALTAAGRPFYLEVALSAPHRGAIGSTSLLWDPPPGYSPGATPRIQYAQAIAYADVAVAEILAQVDLSGTYVMICGDNGADDDGRPEGTPSGKWKGSPYQGGINVPLWVAGPTVVPGATERMVSAIDLPATVCELLGVERPDAFASSVSFADELDAALPGAPARDFVFCERYEVTTSDSYPQPAGFDCRAIIERELLPGIRLKRIIQDADGSGPGAATDTVFNLVADPLELGPTQDGAGFPFSLLPAGIRARMDAELASIPPRR